MIESHYIQTADLRVHYLACGPHDGPPVVFIHGFPQTSHQWRHQLQACAAAGFRAYAPDNRGFGRTDKPRIRISRALLGGDVVRFIDAVGIETCHLVGHDWGGIIAFKAAIDHQTRFQSISLLDTLCTVWSPMAIHGYWFKALGYAERFFENHAADFIKVLFGGADAEVLGSMPESPWPIPVGIRPQPEWITTVDLDHYIDSFNDPDVWFHAIQYYRYGLPFHRVAASENATHGETFVALDEAEVGAIWLHDGTMFSSPGYTTDLGPVFYDYGPEDRHKRFSAPALWMYGNYLGGNGDKPEGHPVGPTGNPFVDQFPRYFPDLRSRSVNAGHFLGEESPEFISATLVDFFNGTI